MRSGINSGRETIYERWAHAWKLLPELLTLFKSRRGILLVSFILMMTNRFAGLILPASTKYLVDDVIGKREMHLLVPIVLLVFLGTVVQGLTLFALTRSLSKSGQRMIVEL